MTTETLRTPCAGEMGTNSMASTSDAKLVERDDAMVTVVDEGIAMGDGEVVETAVIGVIVIARRRSVARENLPLDPTLV